VSARTGRPGLLYRLAAIASAVGIVGAASLVAAPPASAARPPIVVTVGTEAPAYSSFPMTVDVPATTKTVRRSATLTVSRDGTSYTPLSSWGVARRGGSKPFSIDAGTTPGRVWFRVTVTGRGVVPQTRTVSVRITNPYRPSAPDNVDIPESGVPVAATLFGNHPIIGSPEYAGTVRLWDTSTSWNKIERTRGSYTWGALDRAVAAAEAAGQEVLLVLGGTPEWAAVGPAPGSEFAGTGSSMPMTDASLFEDYVRAVLNRYGGRIAAYQIWNEANISQFWRGTPELMADLTARAYAIIKREQPGAVVVAASTGSRWVKGFTEFYPEYLTALGVLGWPVDAYSVHLYPMASGTPRDRTYLLGLMTTALRIAEAPRKPIWETEINYGITNPGTGEAARSIPDAEIPGYVARTYLDSLRFGIARSYWYAWTPEYRLLGIQMWHGYLATRALGTTRDWLVGATFSGCATTGVVVLCNFDRGGTPFYVAYTDDGATASIPAPAGSTIVTGMDGSTVPAGTQVVVSGTPVRIS
jgi:hypothetical protein